MTSERVYCRIISVGRNEARSYWYHPQHNILLRMFFPFETSAFETSIKGLKISCLFSKAFPFESSPILFLHLQPEKSKSPMFVVFPIDFQCYQNLTLALAIDCVTSIKLVIICYRLLGVFSKKASSFLLLVLKN